MKPRPPCLGYKDYNAHPKQQFWFAEVRAKYRQCSREDSESVYRELAEGFNMTEWDVQLENGVLTRLDSHFHTSYSLFPSSHIKKEIPMKFYQRATANYKLECAQDPEKSIDELYEVYHRQKERTTADSEIPHLLNRVDTLGKAAICVLMIVPFASMCATAVFTPLSIITAGGLFAALISDIDDAMPDLEVLRVAYDIPRWLNDCLDGRPIRYEDVDHQLALIDDL